MQNNPNVLGKRFETALIYALWLHRKQRRKVTGAPYICHLLAVAALVIEAGASENGAIAALLHDAVEDQGGSNTLLAIEKQFGQQVAEYVNACSAPSRRTNQDWRSHKLDYLAQIESAPPAVKQIVLADKLHNGRSLLSNLSQFGPSVWRAFSGSPAEIIWLYQAYYLLLKDAGLRIEPPAEVIEQLEVTIRSV